MPAYSFPQPVELTEIARLKGPAIRERSIIWNFFDERDVNADNLRWFQKDLYSGFQNWRGIGGKPSPVAFGGDKEYLAVPGAYGDFVGLDERELMSRTALTSPDGPPIAIDDMVMEAQEVLMHRETQRKEKILWDLLVNGTFSVTDKWGLTVYTGSYTQAAFTASVAWATVATATPFADLIGLPILSRGLEVSYGTGARLLMNRFTANLILKNTNAADMGGMLAETGKHVNTIQDMNNILSFNGVPPIEICEEGYFTAGTTTPSSGAWNLYIPNSKFVLVGKRNDSERLGEYRNTRNLEAASGFGSYSKTIVQDKQVPGSIEVHQGHNGGPVLYYPGSILKGNV
jgi:hypothetical protein